MNMLNIKKAIGLLPALLLVSCMPAQQKHIYLANDNHTDYLWSGDKEAYRNVALNEIDFFLDQTDNTAWLPGEYRSRYNLDGAWYVYTYQQHRSPQEFGRLANQIRSGHISMPYNFLVSTYGGQPTEAVLRGMYWAGKLERAYDLDLSLALSMENQSQPLGLASLWAGAGARYSWKGVCGCASPISVSGLGNRPNEMYRYQGPDSAGVVMKWYNFLSPNGDQRPGGYAEARSLSNALTESEARCNTPHYPYSIAAAFGYGWDDLQALASFFPDFAQGASNATRQVYVSNETDFFEHFLDVYSHNSLPVESWTYGNDWDLNCASLAPVTTNIRNSVEKLRTAEALASVVTLIDPEFYAAEDTLREQAWIALGSYWDHNFAFGGCCVEERNNWHIESQQKVAAYVDGLFDNALTAMARNIPNPSTYTRFFVFNPLGWQRTGVADIEYSGSQNIKVIDIQNNAEVPHQFIERNNRHFLRILAPGIPSVGYKVFEARPATSPPSAEAATLINTVFENDFYRITLTREGAITSLIDKLNGNQELAKETNGRFINDFGQGAGEAGSLTLLNNGPVSATVACTSANPLQHTTLITLYKSINRIDIDNRITDNFGDQIRVYSFSFDFDDPSMWHEELGAVLQAKYAGNGGHYAPPNLGVRHDWQTLNHFADIGNSQHGVILSNSGAAFMKLGNSSTSLLDENSAQVNVLIGGKMNASSSISGQLGLTQFNNRFAIRSRAGAFSPAQAMKFAMEHQNPLVTGLALGAQEALPPDTFSLLQISNDNVLLWALKPAEEGTLDAGMIFRAWNMDTQSHSVSVDFNPDILSASRTTHLETNIEPAAVAQGNLVATIGQQRMETFRLFLDSLATGCSLHTTISQTICQGETYHGHNTSGTFTDTFLTADGCDSTRTLLLTVLANDTTSIGLTTCHPEQAGLQIDTFSNQNGCDSIVLTNTVFVPLPYQVETTNVSCYGLQNGSITVVSAPNYTVAWEDGPLGPGRSGLEAGTYTFTLTNPANGCSVSDSATVSSPLPLQLAVTIQPPSSNTGNDGSASVAPEGGVPPYLILWSTGADSPEIEGLGPGDYSVSVTDANGCIETDSFEITIINSRADIPSLLVFGLHPNPASQQLHLELQFINKVQGEVVMIDPLGKAIYKEKFRGQSYQSVIPVEHLPAGSYQVQVIVGKQKAVKKAIIR